MDELFDMGLHELKSPTGLDIQIIRVPGGWIYNTFHRNSTGGHDITSCFVPLDNEFVSKKS